MIHRNLLILACLLSVWPGLAWGQGDVSSLPSDDAKVRMLIEGLQLHALREDAPVDALDVYPGYEEAQRLEAEVVQMYREIRAAELSLIQRQTMDRSLESTLTPLSERAEVDEALLTESAKDADAVKAYQAELSVVMRETDAIVANTRDLLESLMSKPAPVPPPTEDTDAPQEEELKPELMDERPLPEESATSDSAEQMQALEEQDLEELQQQQAELQQQVEQDLDEVELNLEEALKEIDAASQLVEKKIQENTEAVAQLEKELAEQEEKEAPKEEALQEALKEQKALEALDAKVDKAEELVEAVVEELKEVAEVPEAQLERAEAAIEEMRAALAATQSADAETAEAQQAEAGKHTQAAVEDVQAAQKAMQAAAEGMAAMEQMAKMLTMLGEAELTGGMAIARKQVMGTLARAVSGKWIDLTDQMRGRNLDAKPVEVPPEERPALWKDRNALNLLPISRKVVLDSERGGEWIFVGDWYVLRRYDNAHRANRQKVYPPESILDLNARYLSEDGQLMEWQYASFTPPQVQPYGAEEWKIYYFYTELYFEEPTEAWIAIGSDDRSDLWINDLPVWHSSNEHKGWNPAEGFRKVYFKAGRNQVLLRLENGHLLLGFSLYYNLDWKQK